MQLLLFVPIFMFIACVPAGGRTSKASAESLLATYPLSEPSLLKLCGQLNLFLLEGMHLANFSKHKTVFAQSNKLFPVFVYTGNDHRQKT